MSSRSIPCLCTDTLFSIQAEKDSAIDLIRAMLALSAQTAASSAELDDLLSFVMQMDLAKSCQEKTGKLLRTVNTCILPGCTAKQAWIERLFALSGHAILNLEEFTFGAFVDYMKMWRTIIESEE